jgi:hypothetical protein
MTGFQNLSGLKGFGSIRFSMISSGKSFSSATPRLQLGVGCLPFVTAICFFRKIFVQIKRCKLKASGSPMKLCYPSFATRGRLFAVCNGNLFLQKNIRTNKKM